MSHKSFPQECPTRASHKSFLQECLTRVSLKSVPQECPATVSHKSVLQERLTRSSYKSVPQEFPTRVSHKSVPQECPVRVSHKSFLQECPTRVSYKSVIWTYVAFRTCLHSGSWAPSCFIFFSGKVFHVFSPTVFAFASAGSALQALGAAERAGDEAHLHRLGWFEGSFLYLELFTGLLRFW